MKTPIAVWHYHHARYLVEFPMETIKSRTRFIDVDKLPPERTVRKRLLKRIRGKLPARLVAAYAAREAAYAKREAAYAELRAADAEWGAAYNAELPVIERLHAGECPDCPWDGKTIFTRKNERGEWW